MRKFQKISEKDQFRIQIVLYRTEKKLLLHKKSLEVQKEMYLLPIRPVLWEELTKRSKHLLKKKKKLMKSKILSLNQLQRTIEKTGWEHFDLINNL